MTSKQEQLMKLECEAFTLTEELFEWVSKSNNQNDKDKHKYNSLNKKNIILSK